MSKCVVNEGYSNRLYWCCYGILIFGHILPYLFNGAPALVQMALYTFPTVYIGSHLSLQQREVDPRTGLMKIKPESISRKDAFISPFIGSAGLFLIYLAFKFLSAFWINLLITFYLALAGSAAIGETLAELFNSLLPNSLVNTKYTLNSSQLFFDRIPLLNKIEFSFTLSRARVMGYAIGGILSMTWAGSGHWLLHNFIAVNFCIQGMRMISAGSVKISFIFLIGLFFYDIFWVFATNVMTSVAKSLNAPVKLIFPLTRKPWSQSILGLGDIVVPGTFMAMMLRLDHFIHEQDELVADPSTAKEASDDEGSLLVHQKFPKTYFWSTLIAYEAGLMLTGCVMLLSGKAQPALLYLVPSCLATVLGMAWKRGQLSRVWSYSEHVPDAPPSHKESSSVEAKKNL